MLSDDRPRQKARFYTKNKINIVYEIAHFVLATAILHNKYFIIQTYLYDEEIELYILKTKPTVTKY